MNFILRTLCFVGITMILGTAGIGIYNWQWWSIILIILFYTILLAIRE